MLLRRWGTAAAGLVVVLAGSTAHAVPPYPASEVIQDVAFDWSTLIQLAPGSDNWNITWGADGHQYTAWGDGGGFGGTNGNGRVSLGVARVEGPADGYSGFNINGGLDPESGNSDWVDNPGGKSYGIISIEGILCMWVGPGSGATSYQSQTLFRSDDLGANWTEPGWQFTDAEEMGLPTFVQFGQDYAGARDAFVYMYASRVESPTFPTLTPGIIDLFRAPADDLSNRDAYEFFTGLDGDDEPIWSNDVMARAPVFEDPEGVSFATSAIYIAPAGQYVLGTEHGAGTAGGIGLYDAPEPWGPWTTVFHSDAFGEGDIDATTFFWNFSNKWLSADGSEFVMIYTGVGSNDAWSTVHGTWTLMPVPGDDTGTGGVDTGADTGVDDADTGNASDPSASTSGSSGGSQSGTSQTTAGNSTAPPPATDSGTGGSGADSDSDAGCGCRTDGQVPSLAWVVLTLAALGVRRRRRATVAP